MNWSAQIVIVKEPFQKNADLNRFKGVGVIAGCRVVEGRFPRDGFVIISRRNKKIGEGFIKSLQRDKKTVKEVHAGFECGFLVDGFVDFAEGDTVECFIETAE